jgi:hypothetical protein
VWEHADETAGPPAATDAEELALLLALPVARRRSGDEAITVEELDALSPAAIDLSEPDAELDAGIARRLDRCRAELSAVEHALRSLAPGHGRAFESPAPAGAPPASCFSIVSPWPLGFFAALAIAWALVSYVRLGDIYHSVAALVTANLAACAALAVRRRA